MNVGDSVICLKNDDHRLFEGEEYVITELIYESKFASEESKQRKAIYVDAGDGWQAKLYDDEYILVDDPNLKICMKYPRVGAITCLLKLNEEKIELLLNKIRENEKYKKMGFNPEVILEGILKKLFSNNYYKDDFETTIDKIKKEYAESNNKLDYIYNKVGRRYEDGLWELLKN